jgi:membrane protease YdiL (CAAX protease family)
MPLYLPYLGVAVLPVLPHNHALGALGPLIAGFILTAHMAGKAGTTRLIKAMFLPGRISWLFIALLSPFVLLLLAQVINYIAAGTSVTFRGVGQTNEFPSYNLFEYFIYNLVFFGFGEETGWKGFALPALQRRFNALVSSLIFSVFWAIWHWPLFLYRPGYTSMDAAGIAGWLFSLITGSILLTWLFNSSRGSILVCAVFHAAIDIVFVSDHPDRSVINYLGMMVMIWGVITIAVGGYKNLSKKERIKKCC